MPECLCGHSECPLRYKIATVQAMMHRTYKKASNFIIFHQQISHLKQTFINNSYPNRTFDKILPNYLNRIYTTPNPLLLTPYTPSPLVAPPPSLRPPPPPLILLPPQHKTHDNLIHIKFSTKINFHTTINWTSGSYNK